jgi:hypothetical protein
MGVRILSDRETGVACLYCSTTQWAFGPLFESREDAEEFLAWVRSRSAGEWAKYDKFKVDDTGRCDPRMLTDSGLKHAVSDWLASRRDSEEAPLGWPRAFVVVHRLHSCGGSVCDCAGASGLQDGRAQGEAPR